MASPIASRSGTSAGMANATWSCSRAALIAAPIAVAFRVPTWLLIAVSGPRRASADFGAIAGRIREIASEMAGEPADTFFTALTCTSAGPTHVEIFVAQRGRAALLSWTTGRYCGVIERISNQERQRADGRRQRNLTLCTLPSALCRLQLSAVGRLYCAIFRTVGYSIPNCSR